MTKAYVRQFLGFVACVLAVFLLPYLFPPKSGISFSTMVGFSNRAAQVVLLVGGLLFAVWTKGWGQQLAQQDAVMPRRTRVVLAAVVLFVVGWCGYIWYISASGGPLFEATYFLDRFAEQTAGSVAYRDFTFDYGPLLYYPSWWLASLFALPVGHAYYLFFGLQWVAGVVLLWWVIGRLRARTSDRLLTFLVVAAAWITSIFDGGIQYTPLRFILGSVFALGVHRLWQKADGQSGSARMLPAMLLAFLGFTVLLLLSPEQGIAFWMATILFFALCVRSKAMVVPLAGLSVACTLVTVLAAKYRLFQSILAFSGGDFNLPLLIGPQTIVLVPMLLGIACLVVASFYARQSMRVELYLIALALTCLPAAFGRSDPGHVFVNTLPALIVFSLAQFQSSTRGGIVLASWLLYIFAAYSAHLRGPFSIVIRNAPHLIQMPRRSELPPTDAALRAPMGYWTEVNGQVGPKVHTGRYFGFGTIFSGLAEEKIVELQHHPHDLLVLPGGWQQLCATVSPKLSAPMLSNVYEITYMPVLKAVPNVKMPLCAFIQQHYVKTHYQLPGYGYEVLELRSDVRDPRVMLPVGVDPVAAGLKQ